ncbi:MAG: hypothetical protein IJP78_11535 [Clostridia bacterium]|nr:hypothetical protein [Clostridia bacterium]
MKKVLCLLLCLMLALAAPLSALSESQSWLLPFIKRGDAVQSGEAVVTLHMDPEAVRAVIDWYYSMQLESYEELAKSWAAYYEEQGEATGEADYYDSFIKSAKQSLNTTRATIKAYLPGAAALADASEILVHSGENLSAWEYRVDGKPWFTLNLIVRPEEGDVLLTSDLFPSCVLSLPQSGATAEASGQSVQKLLALWQELMATLPDYEGFDLLGQVYEAEVQALRLLEAEGLAHWEGDALVYERTVSLPGAYDSIPDEAEDALYERRALDVDERVYTLYDLTAPLRTPASLSVTYDFWEQEAASNALFMLGENATDEEYRNAYNEYMRLIYKNRTETTTQTRRVTLENGEITNETTVTVSTHYEPLIDETGTLEKLKEMYKERYGYSLSGFTDYETTNSFVSRHTPTAYEYHRAPTDFMEETFRLDTGAENVIVFTYETIYHNSGVEDEVITAEVRLTRTDEGQQWTVTAPVQMTADAEPLRVTLSLDNDVTRMDMTLSMLGKELGSIRAEYAYSEASAALPDVSGLTVIPYDDTEAMKALYAELRTVAVPKLTKLITTGLPKGAKGLIVPLLAAVASLGQIGK